MHDTRYQSSLIAALALALGSALTFALSSGTAIGYPTDAVSYGANPTWSVGGAIHGDGSVILTTVPADQSLVVTDVVLAVSSRNVSCSTVVEAGLGAGASSSLDTDSLGRFAVGMARDQASYTQYHPIQTVQLSSGAKVDPGVTLMLHADVRFEGGCYGTDEVTLNYMVSGYYAQP